MTAMIPAGALARLVTCGAAILCWRNGCVGRDCWHWRLRRACCTQAAAVSKHSVTRTYRTRWPLSVQFGIYILRLDEDTKQAHLLFVQHSTQQLNVLRWVCMLLRFLQEL